MGKLEQELQFNGWNIRCNSGKGKSLCSSFVRWFWSEGWIWSPVLPCTPPAGSTHMGWISPLGMWTEQATTTHSITTQFTLNVYYKNPLYLSCHYPATKLFSFLESIQQSLSHKNTLTWNTVNYYKGTISDTKSCCHFRGEIYMSRRIN